MVFVNVSDSPALHFLSFFFFNDTATTEIYTLSLHDALPISNPGTAARPGPSRVTSPAMKASPTTRTRSVPSTARSEEHTSELQSQSNLVCRLLLEKKKKSSASATPRRTSQTLTEPSLSHP